MGEGYVESFNGKLRDELLNRELFDTLWEVQVLTEQWRHEYNHQRPHSALGYRPPAPEAILTSSAPSGYQCLMICGTPMGGRSTTRAREELGWRSQIPLEDGLRGAVQWIEENWGGGSN